MGGTEGYLVVCTADLAKAKRWYSNLFGREPDRTPMTEVHEWYFGAGGLQLLTSRTRAGSSRIILTIDNLERVRSGLGRRGIELMMIDEHGERRAQLPNVQHLPTVDT